MVAGEDLKNHFNAIVVKKSYRFVGTVLVVSRFVMNVLKKICGALVMAQHGFAPIVAE